MGKRLDWIERVGNRFPDPAVLFVLALGVVWVCSWVLGGHAFTVRSVEGARVLQVENQLDGEALVSFLVNMVDTFTGFAPLGVVLVVMLGAGVAEHAGFVGASLRALLSLTPGRLVTPMLLLVAILSHVVADAGFVLVIPLGAAIFHAAGRHPLAGIACAFAGVSGGFGASIIPSSIEPLLQGFTQSAARIVQPDIVVNPLANWWFTAASSIVVIGVGWYVTDRIVEPRLRGVAVDGDGGEGSGGSAALAARERRGLAAGFAVLALGILLVAVAALPASSPLRGPDSKLTGAGAPLMQAIVPLLFLLFLVPGAVYGRIAGTLKGHRDLIQGMTRTMSTMSYYLVMIFFCAQFTAALAHSNVGALLAVRGAGLLESLALPDALTVVGVILLSAFVNLFVGSASGKWAFLAPVLVPAMMQVGIAPELTQAVYRIGDCTTNIITPLMPYFPLVVVFCQRWVRTTGVGTLISLMVPYSLGLGAAWILFLLAYWGLGLPLGLDASYAYP